MTRFVWLNGSVVDASEARVSAFDAGVQHGVGLFETMLACATEACPAGRVYQLAEHLGRLERSARDLGLMSSLNARALAETVEDAVIESGICRGGSEPEVAAAGNGVPARAARVRITLTGGDLNLLQRARAEVAGGGGGGGSVTPTVLVDVTPAQEFPSEMFERGVGVMVASAKANPLNEQEGHKTLNYWWRLRALQDAAAQGMGDALVLQVSNHVCGGAVSNVFVVRDGVLVTPIARGEEASGAVPSPVLPGVTRAAVIGWAEQRGMGCEKRMVTIDDVLDADEVFLTNSSWGVLPVVRVEGKKIGRGAGEGVVGEVASGLKRAWLDATVADV